MSTSTAKQRVPSAASNSSGEPPTDGQLNELMDANGLIANGEGAKKALELADDEAAEGENVAVMVRCRPIVVSSQASSTSTGDQLEAAVKVDEASKCVEAGERQFFYDQVFGPECNSELVYMRSARRLVDCAFKGYNCAIFLYGQTGTGKTYTHSSLTLAAFEHLFGLIQDSNKGMRFLVRASYYELYNEEIRDLLAPKTPPTTSSNKSAAPKSLELRESKERGVYVRDLTCFLVNNLAELKRLKQLGDKRRTTAATRMNEHSSRSHSIFTITIETTMSSSSSSDIETPPKASRRQNSAVKSARKQPAIRVGHLNLVDLAGSERQSKSGASGLALKEASQINLSLTCLSLVIRALTDKQAADEAGGKKAHVPYRNSKLTRLLSSSLGGNSKTVLIACVSMARANLDETLNTLRFASRTKQIKNRAVINEDPKDALLRKYRKQLEELRLKLSEHQREQKGVSNRSDLNQADVATQNEEATSEVANEISGEQLKLNKQLELLKAKIMFGGENLLDKLELHERLLEASKMELEERQRAEAKLREQLMSKEQTIEQVVQSKGSLESQLEYLNGKLEKAISLYRGSKLELRDLANEHEQLKEALLQTIKSTSKEIKYVDCIIEDFIPRPQLDLINAYAQFDDESDEWQIKYIALSGNNIAQTRRLVTDAGALTSSPSSSPLVATSGVPVHQAVRRDRKLSAGMSAASQRRRRKAPKSGGDDENSATSNRPDPFLRLM